MGNTLKVKYKFVTSSKRRHKNSMKCAIAKFLNQDGRPDRYRKLKRMMENSAKGPPTLIPEREYPTPHHPEGERTRNCAILLQKDKDFAEKCLGIQILPVCGL